MLQVFYGNDQLQVREQAHVYIDSVLGEGQEAVRLESDNYESGLLSSVSGAMSLFSSSNVYVVDTPSLNKDFYAELMDLVEALVLSSNTFVLIEKDINAADKKKFTKHTEDLHLYKKTASKDFFNVFKMAEALSRKDKRSLWVLLCEAKRNGLSAEEITGTLWWQLKTMRLASLTSSAEEAGVKDFPYNKAKQTLRNFKDGELEALSFSLMNLYHDGHKGKRDIDMALEEWVLKV
jgi:hypothetical protein